MHIDGGCHCRAIRYEAEIDPERVAICHCTDCQTLTGSPYRVTALVDRDALRLTRGTPRVYTKLGDNGRRRFQHFCGDCGTPLFTGGEGEGARDWGIRWGSIVQRDSLPPKRQIWQRSAVPWCGGIAALPARPRD